LASERGDHAFVVLKLESFPKRSTRLVKRRAKQPQKAVPRGLRYWPDIWLSTALVLPLIHDFARLCALLTASGCASVPPNSPDEGLVMTTFLRPSRPALRNAFMLTASAAI